MKTVIVKLVILISITFTWLYDRSIGGFEFYGFIYCKSNTACIHEQGHVLDRKLGNISETEEYKKSIIEYANGSLLANSRNEIVDKILVFPGVNQPMSMSGFASRLQGGWGGYKELYADIWANCDGNIEQIPVSLQPYFRAESED